jgi:hypothetical protein
VKAVLFVATLFAVAFTSPPRATAQPPGAPGSEERDRTFVEMLRREDPASAEQYVTLRDARSRAVAELHRMEEQYRAAGVALRPIALPQLRQAQRRYAEASLALLEFIDARDRRALATYREEIGRINKLLEEHERMRAELRRLLDGN